MRSPRAAHRYRKRSNGDHATPLIGYGIVDPEDASIKCGLHFLQPMFKRCRLADISGARKFNAFADLAEDKRAQKERVVGDRGVPCGYALIAALAPCESPK
jgi:hypothetical protein